jgi:cell division septation protein DedD
MSTTVAFTALAATPAHAEMICIDPPPPPYSYPTTTGSIAIEAATPTSLTVFYQLPYSCYSVPVRTRVVVDGVPREPFDGGVRGTVKVNDLLPGRRYTVALEFRIASDWEQVGTIGAMTTPEGTPTPTPPPPTLLCIAPSNGQTRLQSRITVNTNADASQVSLSWGIAGSTGGFPDLCVMDPTEWDLYVDGIFVAHVTGHLGGEYTLTGLSSNSFHTFDVTPTNNSSVSGLTRTIEIVPGYTDPPFVPTPDVTPTPTPTPPPPTPTPTPIQPTPDPTPDPTPTPEPPTPTPTPEPTEIAAEFAGQGSLLVRTAGLAGTFAATNAVDLTLPVSGTGTVEGSLSGFTRGGTVMLGGLFPAKTSLTYSGSALTGTSAAGRVTATAGGTLAFGRTTILGITLTAGTACRTVSDVRMALAGPVTAGGGGKLAGTVTLPRFSGCNTLGTFLGTTAAKSAISLALTPAPVATS